MYGHCQYRISFLGSHYNSPISVDFWKNPPESVFQPMRFVKKYRNIGLDTTMAVERWQSVKLCHIWWCAQHIDAIATTVNQRTLFFRTKFRAPYPPLMWTRGTATTPFGPHTEKEKYFGHRTEDEKYFCPHTEDEKYFGPRTEDEKYFCPRTEDEILQLFSLGHPTPR